MKKLLLIAFVLGTMAVKADTGDDRSDVKVFPNPATPGTVVKVEVKDEIRGVEVIDMTGKAINVPVVITGEGTIEIKTDSCPEGIYFIKVRTPKANMVSKLVVN